MFSNYFKWSTTLFFCIVKSFKGLNTLYFLVYVLRKQLEIIDAALKKTEEKLKDVVGKNFFCWEINYQNIYDFSISKMAYLTVNISTSNGVHQTQPSKEPDISAVFTGRSWRLPKETPNWMYSAIYINHVIVEIMETCVLFA